MPIITGHIADSAGQPLAGRIEFAQAARIDNGTYLVTSTIATAQVEAGELRALDGGRFTLPKNPDGTAVRVREFFGGRTFEWWTAVPDDISVEYRELPLVESADMPSSVWGPPPWLAQAEQARDETQRAIEEGRNVAEALGGLPGITQAVEDAQSASSSASSSAASAEADKTAAEAARDDAERFAGEAGRLDDEAIALNLGEQGSLSRESLRSAIDVLSPMTDVASGFYSTSVVSAFTFRSAQDQAWVQGFSLDITSDRVYISRQITGATGLKIEVRTLAGALLESKSFETDAVVYMESLNWWRNSSGDLCFLGRRSASKSYCIINFTAGTVGESISIEGGYSAMAVSGRSMYTCDAYQSTQDGAPATFVSTIYEYDLESVKAGTPSLLRTIGLTPRGSLPAKMQGFCITRGEAVFFGGAIGAGPTIVSYSLAGVQNAALSMDKRSFGEMVNRAKPGTITDLASFTHEGEGVFFDGTFYTGHVVGSVAYGESFVIVRHGAAGSERVTSAPTPLPASMPETILQAANPRLVISSTGDTVYLDISGGLYLDGAYVGLPAGTETVFFPAGTIPDWLQPRTPKKFAIPASNGTQFVILSIATNGAISLRNPNASTAGNLNDAAVSWRRK